MRSKLKFIYGIAAAGLLAGALALELHSGGAVIHPDSFTPDGTAVVVDASAKAQGGKPIAPAMPPAPQMAPAPPLAPAPDMPPAPPMTAAPRTPPAP